MSIRRQVNFFYIPGPLIAVIAVVLLSSCVVVKKYEKDKPFIFRSTVTLNTDLPNPEKVDLKNTLTTQMDDSLRVRPVLTLGFPRLIYYRLLRPPAFDSAYILRSKTFMNALLNSEGFFNPVITDTFYTVAKNKKEKRVYVKFYVKTGKVMKIDSIGYAFDNAELQRLAMQNFKKSDIKKGAAYSINKVSAELDRLLALYRDNGYYKISKEDLYVEQDTVVAALIDPNLDPFEQLALLDSLQKKKTQPTITVVFKQRELKDTSRLEKYYWGKINVVPDRFGINDTLARRDSTEVGQYTFFPRTEKFKLPFIARNIAAKEGALYKQADYFKTINTFTTLGAWQQVDMNLKERIDSVRLLDANVSLYPARKRSMNVDFETSRNANDVLTTGSLFGIGLNLGLRNRNGFRESVPTASNIRLGVELGKNFIQTVQASISHSIFVPRFITPFRIPAEKTLTAPRTIINLNAAYTDRRKLFTVRSFNASWGYDWTKKSKNWQYIPFNFELTDVSKSDSLRKLEAKYPTIGQAFNNGIIIGQILAFSTARLRQTGRTAFRVKLEESGAIAGLFTKFEKGDLRRFVKLDVELKHFIDHQRSAWAFRAFGGYGFVYGRSGANPENNLPFFKAYFGGGPYSMRAWQVRQLGPGSTSVFRQDTVVSDRFGDMMLEGNIEYRFDLATIAGIKVKSALFTDMGNIWAKTYRGETRLDSTEFKLSRLYRDLAVGAGTSLRLDFDFFLIRFDWAYKVKNPVYDEHDGWFQKLQIDSGQFQLGIGYSF
jgi:outer membrane protein insertion porin family